MSKTGPKKSKKTLMRMEGIELGARLSNLLEVLLGRQMEVELLPSFGGIIAQFAMISLRREVLCKAFFGPRILDNSFDSGSLVDMLLKSFVVSQLVSGTEVDIANVAEPLFGCECPVPRPL